MTVINLVLFWAGASLLYAGIRCVRWLPLLAGRVQPMPSCVSLAEVAGVVATGGVLSKVLGAAGSTAGGGGFGGILGKIGGAVKKVLGKVPSAVEKGAATAVESGAAVGASYRVEINGVPVEQLV